MSGAHVCEHVDTCINAVDEGSVCEWRTRVYEHVDTYIDAMDKGSVCEWRTRV